MFLAGHSVAMATYYFTKMITKCSPMVGLILGTMIVAASVIKSGYNDPSKSKNWKLSDFN